MSSKSGQLGHEDNQDTVRPSVPVPNRQSLVDGKSTLKSLLPHNLVLLTNLFIHDARHTNRHTHKSVLVVLVGPSNSKQPRHPQPHSTTHGRE